MPYIKIKIGSIEIEGTDIAPDSLNSILSVMNTYGLLANSNLRVQREKLANGPERAVEPRKLADGKYTTICSKCGGQAETPFKPRPDKPVLCTACYQRKDDAF